MEVTNLQVVFKHDIGYLLGMRVNGREGQGLANVYRSGRRQKNSNNKDRDKWRKRKPRVSGVLEAT